MSFLPRKGTFGLTAGALGTWQLIGDGLPSTFEIDFVNDRASGGSSISSLLSCDRDTPASQPYENADGTVSYFAADTLRYGTNGLLVEESRVNIALQASDFTNASWTKSNMTTAKTATGPDGVSNSASTLTASAGNATALQAITSGNAARITSVYLKRRTGTGNIDLTQDNGSTWATKVITSSWARYSIASVTSTNPTVGIRIVTSADAVDVFLFQHEVGAFITSPIPTTIASVTRAKDLVTFASIPAVITTIAAAPGTVYLEYPSTGLSINYYFDFDGGGGNRPLAYKSGASANTYFDGTNNPGGVTEAATGSTNKLARAWSSTTMSQVINGAANVGDSWDGDWNIGTPQIGSGNGGNYQINGYIRRLAAWNSRLSNGALQTLTT